MWHVFKSFNGYSHTHTHRYKCTDRVLTVSSASHLLDTGSYCCEIDSESRGSDGTVCIDIQVGIRGELLQGIGIIDTWLNFLPNLR